MTQHIVIVGAGIIGSALAFRLAEAGAAVTLIDRAGVGAGASSKSFGWINANDPAPAAYNRFRQEAIAAWHRVPEALAIPARWQGSLACETGENALRAHAEALSDLGCAARVVDRDEIAQLAPGVAGLRDTAVYCETEGAVDAFAAARAFSDAAVALGARRLAGMEVQSLLMRGDRVIGVSTSFGPLTADLVVLAAGIHSAELAATAGIDLPMANATGLIVQTRPVAPVIAPVILTEDVHFRQEPDGRIIMGEIFSGNGPNATLIDSDPGTLADMLLTRLRARLPGVKDLALGTVTLGIRPTPADGLPIIGSAAPGLYLTTMHSGVTLAPLVGECATRDILSGTPIPDLADYRLARFSPVG